MEKMERLTIRLKRWDGSLGKALLAERDPETREINNWDGYDGWDLLRFSDDGCFDGDDLQEILERLAYYEDKAEQEERERGDNN